MKTDRRTKLFYNGTIYTGSAELPFCEAVLTCGEHIVFTGSLADAKKVQAPGTTPVDLEGAFMLPGFIDAHLHLVWGGEYLHNIDLSNVNSKEAFVKALHSFLPKRPGKWVLGGNWNQFNFTDAAMPDRNWIDDITGDVPVLLHRMDYHIALANGAALALAGISPETSVPEGGEMVKDSSGRLTGILKDAAIDLVTACIPKPGNDQMRAYIKRTLAEANAHGITSVHDISAPEHIPVLKDMERKGQLTARVYSRLPLEQYQNFINLGITHNFGRDYLKLGSLKAFADGSLGAGTAWMFDDFTDEPGNKGFPMQIFSSGNLEKFAAEADENHLQLSVHAIGDRANHEILNLLERISRQNAPWDRRFRIEHAQHLSPSDLQRFSTLGVVASMQPLHLFEDGSWMHTRIGKHRAKEAYLFGSLLASGAKVCFGSDFPIVSLNPIAGMYAAITRSVKNGTPETDCNSSEIITMQDAIACYTQHAAYAAFEENCKGSIECGKLADFAVLDKNLFLTEYEQIPQTRVLRTFVGANEVYHI